MLVELIDRLIYDSSGLNLGTIRNRLLVLRDQAEAVEAELQATKAQLLEAQTRIKELEAQAQAHDLKPKADELPKDAIRMLDLLFDRRDLAIEYMAEALGIERGMGEHYRDVLQGAGLIHQTGMGFQGFGAMGDWVDTSGAYGLTSKGREYVAKIRSK